MIACTDVRPNGADDTLEPLSPLAIRVRGEYLEMPGLRLTANQAARLFGLAPELAVTVLRELQRKSILRCSDRGMFVLVAAGK